MNGHHFSSSSRPSDRGAPTACATAPQPGNPPPRTRVLNFDPNGTTRRGGEGDQLDTGLTHGDDGKQADQVGVWIRGDDSHRQAIPRTPLRRAAGEFHGWSGHMARSGEATHMSTGAGRGSMRCSDFPFSSSQLPITRGGLGTYLSFSAASGMWESWSLYP